MGSGDAFSIVLALLGTIAVLIFTYYGSRWYAKRVSTAAGNIPGGNHIKIIERLVVGKSSSILIVDIEGEQLLIGVSDQNIQLLKIIDGHIELPEKPEKANFAKILKSLSNKDSKHD